VPRQAAASRTSRLRRPGAGAQRAGAERTERGGSGANAGPVIWRLWHDPIDDEEFYFPDGVFLTVLEGEDLVLDFTPLPFKDDDGRAFKNVVIRQYTAPGSAWGHPPADDLVPLQEQLDLAQSLAFLILMHHASPRTFIPSTVTLNDKLTGACRARTSATARWCRATSRTSSRATAFPEALKWFLDVHHRDVRQGLEAERRADRPAAAGRPDARRGGDPAGARVRRVPGAARAARRLREAAVAQVAVDHARVRVGAALPRLLGDNGDWKLQAFTGADLEGHVTIDIDLATAWPKSPMLTNLRLSKAFELGILNPQDPKSSRNT
jgi:hypothetical protein